MTVQVRVQWRGHRAAFGPRLFGDGTWFDLETAQAIAAELRGRGHLAAVEPAPAASSPENQMELFPTRRDR